MFDLIFNKDDSFFFEKKLSFSWGAPQENTRNPAIPCQLPDCCHIGAGLGEQCQKLSKSLKRLCRFDCPFCHTFQQCLEN